MRQRLDMNEEGPRDRDTGIGMQRLGCSVQDAEVGGQSGRCIRFTANRATPPPDLARKLLLLLGMHGVLAQPRRVLLQLELFATRLTSNRVVMVARLVAYEKDRIDLLFPFSTWFLSHDFMLESKLVHESTFASPH